MNHIEIIITVAAEPEQELLIAQLSAIGFDGFEQSETTVKAFIEEESFDEAALKEILSAGNYSYEQQLIPKQNWNAVWESNFEPVTVEDKVYVRAAFHPTLTGFLHEIVITPKMSFGTGHHATTWLMMREMFDLNFKEKSVFDFGTGTGILAILASKLGAGHVLAADNDEWSIENALENAENNHCENISIYMATDADIQEPAEIILANINKNVILANMQLLSKYLAVEGVLLLSGLLAEDEPDIKTAAEAHGLKVIHTKQRDKWICLKLRHR
jgi:ribosomal protein L11 methyltransferase